VGVDLSNPQATRDVLAHMCAEHAATRLVNNVGVLHRGPLGEVTLADYEAALALNLKCALLCVQAVLPAMEAAGFGRIVNVTSRATLGREERTLYSATKGALDTATRTWATELMPKGITVNSVAPGVIDTRMHRNATAHGDTSAPAIHRSILAGHPGEAADVANAVAFFLDARSGYVTGQKLYVCGGLSIGGIVGDAP
jgi:NAD(P)-dependent dehydrogenase (short-subunit alcohol dehydrogenase family)